MKTRPPWIFRSLLLTSWIGFVTAPSAIAQQDDAEVLTRGPIHEAYANVASAEREATQIVNRRPPEAIDELPPDQKPDGDNVTWIGGYWAWDDDYNDFIWVSGVWRDIPPDRQWIPGYWADAAGGYQYVPGYWEDLERNTAEYLPVPPERLDRGPSSPSPGTNYNWAPGSWRWVDRSYYWQPGYWVPVQTGWIWTPSYYVWTPRGYVFVAGYWDYDLPRRGVCYAPVYYRQPYYHRVGYYYTPRLAIDINIAIGHFFVRPRSCHYYFGDYYGDRHRRRGYDPWYSIHERRDRWSHYDPIFVNYRERELRRDRDWDRHMEERYEFRRQHSDARPARTLVAQEQVERRRLPQSVDRNDLVLAKPIEQVAQRTERGRPLTRVNEDNRKELQARNREVNEYRAERRQVEAQPRQTPDQPEIVTRTRSARGPERQPQATTPTRPRTQPAPETTRPEATREEQRAPQATPPPSPTSPERGRPTEPPRRTTTAREREAEPRATGPAPRDVRESREPVRTAPAPAPRQEQQQQPATVRRSEAPAEERTLRKSPVASRPDQRSRAPQQPEIPSVRREQSQPSPAPQPQERTQGKGRGRGQPDERGRPR